MLRARRIHKEESLELHMPDPIIGPPSEDPEAQAVLTDSVSFALFLVLDTLSPDERLAFILHDMFGVPFDEIATILDKSPEAARKLASRARTRVRSGAPHSDSPRSERAVVDAFLRAAQTGDMEGLMQVLHPDVVIRNDVRSGSPDRHSAGGGLGGQGRTGLLRGAQYLRAIAPPINGAPGAIGVHRREDCLGGRLYRGRRPHHGHGHPDRPRPAREDRPERACRIASGLAWTILDARHPSPRPSLQPKESSGDSCTIQVGVVEITG